MQPIVSASFAELAHVEQRVFERGLNSLRSRWQAASDATRSREFLAVLDALQASSLLNTADLAQRIQIIFGIALLPSDQAAAIAAAARSYPPAIRNAVTTVLPPALRKHVWERPETSRTEPSPPSPPEALPEVPSTRGEATNSSSDDDVPKCRAVLLLGGTHEHEANRTLLQKHEFTPLLVTDLKNLPGLMNEDVCGIVVARSWWLRIPEEQRKEVLQELLCHSSFTWVKLDTENLPCSPEEIDPFLRTIRFETPRIEELDLHDGCNLSPYNIPFLGRASTILAAAAQVQLCPADIKTAQAQVLIGAAWKLVKNRNTMGTIHLTRVETSTIQGGQSQAQVVRLSPDDGGPSMIAKLDAIPRLHDEMCRFQKYVALWDQQLRPQFHRHAGTGLILFSLVESPDAPDVPAPSLEDKLQSLYYSEQLTSEYSGPTEADLWRVIERSVDKLKKLNSRVGDADTHSMAWVTVSPLNVTRGKGQLWNIPLARGAKGDVFSLLPHALDLVQQRRIQAVGHGDVHLRNILVRDNRDPYFIDYAYCGPAHPSFDLARLDGALTFRFMRAFATEDRIASMFYRMLEGASDSTIFEEFPDLATCATNRLAIRTGVATRAAALDVLNHFGGGEDDYLAMKLVTSCQALLLLDTDKNIVRAMLSALGAVIEQRPGWLPADGAKIGTSG
jgi:hypothetical protein